MKKVIRMTESQLKDIVFNVVKEQGTPVTNPIMEIGLNIKGTNQVTQYSCIPDNLMTKGKTLSYYMLKDNKGDHYFYSDGSYRKFKDNTQLQTGTWKCGGQSIQVFDREDPKLISYFPFPGKTTQNKNTTINVQNCAPQLVDVTKGKILKFGCKTQGVKELQTLLDFTTPTGYFGNVTKQKVMDFQKNNNLKVDGIVGPETYKVLTQKALTVPQNVNEYDEDYEDDDISVLDKLFKTEDDYDGEPYRGDEEGFSNKMRDKQIQKSLKLGDVNMSSSYYTNKDRKKQREFEKRKYAGLDPLRNDNQPEPYSPIKSDDLPLDKYLEKKKMRELDEEDDFSILDNLFNKDETPSMETNEQGGTQNTNLTVPEQTLLGFLNRFLKGEEGEFQNTPIEQLKSNMLFNSKTIYPMAQKLLEKKRTGKKTYDDKTFNALFLSMDKAITKEQRYEFFNDAANITNITYNSQY